MPLTDIEKVRIEIQDTAGPGLFILSDETINYFLTKYNNNVIRASLDAARAVLFQLSQQGNETVDILSLGNAKTAENYRLALQMYLRDPTLNPISSSVRGYAGGISISDIESNNANLDNNIVQSPGASFRVTSTDYFSS